MMAQRVFTDPSHFSIVTVLADIQVYGLVGLPRPAAPPAALSDGASLWGVDDTRDPPGFDSISPRLRACALRLGTPVADRRLLGAMAALHDQVGAHVVYLPRIAPATGFADHLTRMGVQAVARRALMLREYRRQELRLSATLDTDVVDQEIYARYFLPVAEAVLRHAMPKATTVRICTVVPVGQVVQGFAPVAPLADDPVSQNVFGLAMRTGFHGPNAAVLRPWLRLSPGQFGLRVRKANPITEGMRRIALTVPQLHLLSPLDRKGDFHA